MLRNEGCIAQHRRRRDLGAPKVPLRAHEITQTLALTLACRISASIDFCGDAPPASPTAALCRKKCSLINGLADGKRKNSRLRRGGTKVNVRTSYCVDYRI